MTQTTTPTTPTNILTPNYKISTITVADLIPVATQAVARFTKGRDNFKLLRYFGSHMTQEDLVMEAVEKVIRANPVYLTKSYVYTAARCACIDRLQHKKIPWTEIQALYTHEDGDIVPIEELLTVDIFNHVADLEEYIKSALGGIELQVFNSLLERKLYVEIAEELKISMRTLERQVQHLKWKIEFLLTEEEPKT